MLIILRGQDTKYIIRGRRDMALRSGLRYTVILGLADNSLHIIAAIIAVAFCRFTTICSVFVVVQQKRYK